MGRTCRSMMRLIFIVRRLDRGGAERQLLELLRRLDKTIFDVSLVCLYPGGALWDEAQSISNIRLRHFERKSRWDLRAIPALWRYLRDSKPDLVHGYMVVANVLALLAKAGGAKVVWGIRATKVDLAHYGHFYRVAFWMESVLSRFPDAIICNSHKAREELGRNGFPMRRMVAIPNGIDVQRFRKDSASRSVVRAQWGVEAEEFLIGIVARIDPMKGHAIFLRAAKQLTLQHPEVRFVIVGSGPESRLRALRELAKHLELGERLIWAGERSDVPAVMSALDLNVSASIFGEGFSNALGEAMACEVPCVATDVGDSARVLGEAGWLVEPGDATGLADRMSKAVHLCRRQPARGSESRRHIEQNFSMERLVESTTAVLCAIGRGTRAEDMFLGRASAEGGDG